MTGAVFVDTNVLVYNRDSTEPHKQPIAQRWLEHLWQTRLGRLSVQVLQEYYLVVTERLSPGLHQDAARGDVRNLFRWRPVPMSTDVLEGAWMARDRFSLSWWDALIVSAAQIGGCDYLLSEDFQHDQDLAGVRIVNPFELEPDALSS